MRGNSRKCVSKPPLFLSFSANSASISNNCFRSDSGRCRRHVSRFSSFNSTRGRDHLAAYPPERFYSAWRFPRSRMRRSDSVFRKPRRRIKRRGLDCPGDFRTPIEGKILDATSRCGRIHDRADNRSIYKRASRADIGERELLFRTQMYLCISIALSYENT